MKKKIVAKYKNWDFKAVEDLGSGKFLYKIVFPGGYSAYLQFGDDVAVKTHIDKMEKDFKK